jgi:hypothetical protein
VIEKQLLQEQGSRKLALTTRPNGLNYKLRQDAEAALFRAMLSEE